LREEGDQEDPCVKKKGNIQGNELKKGGCFRESEVSKKTGDKQMPC